MPALPFVPAELVGRRVVMLFSMWLDDAEDPAGEEMINRLCEVGESLVKASTVMPFAGAVQHLIDVEFEDGHRYYTKEAHVAELADEAIDRLVDFWKDMPPVSTIQPGSMASPRRARSLAARARASAGCPCTAAPAAESTTCPSASSRQASRARSRPAGGTPTGPVTKQPAEALSATTSGSVNRKSR